MSKSARRTLELLQAVVTAEEPPALMQISGATGLDKSTAARLLRVLEDMAILRRDPTTKRYTVGPGMVMLANSVTARLDTSERVYSLLSELRDLTEESVSLHVRVGNQRVCVYGLESHHETRRVIRVGSALPLTRGTAGRMLLAMMAPEEAQEVIRANTGSEAEARRLSQLVEAARADGYAIADSVTAVGVRAACVPMRVSKEALRVPPARGVQCIPMHVGEELWVLGVSGPSSRWLTERAHDLLPDMVQAARRFEECLGGDGLDGRAQPTERMPSSTFGHRHDGSGD